MSYLNKIVRCMGAGMFPILLSACATTHYSPDPSDPWQGYNRAMFSFDMTMDKAVFRPIAETYVHVTPKFVQYRASDFFSNLNQVSVTVNATLQGKPRALEDLTRFLFNTTFGIGGLFDVATPLGLPKHNEDFGITLAVWGVPQGPYVVLPLFGPSTLRNIPSLAVDGWALNPITYYPYSQIDLISTTLKYTVERARLLPYDFIIDTVPDAYAFVRSAYLQHRNYLITRNLPPKPKKKAVLNPLQQELLQMNPSDKGS